MIGKEELNEEVVFKVNDRRKFNADGSLRDGVEIVPETPKIEAGGATGSSASAPLPSPEQQSPPQENRAATAPPASAAAQQQQSTPTPDQTANSKFESAGETAAPSESPSSPSSAAADDEDFPGADDPASFVNFLSTLATNAAAALGAMPHPVTGQRTLDLDTGKYWIDVLAMLGEKTKNNLHPKEQELFEGILGDLRMQYVQMVRLSEEKLKQKAAQKFSAGDILGRK